MKYESMSDKEKNKIIKELYINQKKSFQQIASIVSSYANKIRRDAKKFNISIRSKSEAQTLALNEGRTNHPTKGQKRSQSTKDKIGSSVMKNWANLEPSEIDKRKNNAKQQWSKLSDEQKKNMVKMANKAVRETSKNGSKLEKFIMTGLIKYGYKVDFHKEQTLINTKLQIDIFLPEINVAIEVDGPSHFLPVWGEDTLKRNVKYDNKKTGLLLGKGCVIIRIRQTRDFSPARARKILDNIVNHLTNIKKKFPDQHNRTIEIGD